MEPESTNILMQLLQLSPVVAILVWVVYYFKRELEIKNLEIKELNGALRESQKETLIAITKLTEVVGDLKEIIQNKLK